MILPSAPVSGPLEHLRDIFDRSWPLLEPAAARFRTHSKEDVWLLLATNRAHLWVTENSAGVTQPLAYPSGPKLEIWLSGGKLEEIVAVQRVVATWAKALGYKALSCNGRPGWERALESEGWRKTAVLLERIL